MKKKIIYLIFIIALISSFFILYNKKNTHYFTPNSAIIDGEYKAYNFSESMKNKNFSNDRIGGTIFASPFRIMNLGIFATFRDINFSNSNLKSSVFTDNIAFYDCNFKGSDMSESLISTTNLVWRPMFFDCNFDEVNFKKSRILSGSFVDCSFNNAILSETTILGNFNNCSFNNAVLSDSVINDSFYKCTFKNTNFNGSNLSSLKNNKDNVFNNIITNENTVLPKEMTQIKTLNPNK